MTELKFRQYEESDHDKVWQLHEDGLKRTGSFVDNPEFDKDLHDIRKIYREFILALLDENIVGMGALKQIDETTAEIKRVRVDAVYQAQGIGSKITDYLISKASRLGFRKIILDTSSKQQAAVNLYTKKGFKVYKREKVGDLEMIYFELEL